MEAIVTNLSKSSLNLLPTATTRAPEASKPPDAPAAAALAAAALRFKFNNRQNKRAAAGKGINCHEYIS